MRTTRTACTDRVEEHPLGAIHVTPSLARVYSLNTLVVEDDRPGLTLDEVEAVLAEHHDAATWASALIADDATAAPVEAQARERGWKVEHELLMELRREPDRVVDTGAVQEGDEEAALTLASRWFREDFGHQGEDVLAELDRYAQREWDSRPTRLFVTGDRLAMCKLWSDGTTAQVEDVFTAPEARGHGHARTLVTHAIGEARDGGHDLVFILADDDDTPKELYARLGFDPLARLTRVVRPTG
jgi:GNAT superfamily N-acetyltransferase